jgi:sulfate/thiosulfate transport system ATP-binding protein
MQIELRGVSKRFGQTEAVRNVNLSIRSGELLALLGPSGSGKTTLLRILAGLEEPDAGEVRFGGSDATHFPLRERQVGFVFQHYALFRHMTVFENVAFGMRVKPRRARPHEAAIRRRVGELLDLVQVGDLALRYPSQISGGQRQRVALARALAIDPKVLLLDEPFGALDAQVRKDLRRWLRGLHDRIHITSVFVTHDQEDAMELADRVVILNQGSIEQVGTPDEVYERPASAFVNGFVGEASGLDVRVEKGEIWWGDRRIAANTNRTPDGPARMFVRPHEFSLSSDASHGLPGTVQLMHLRGGQQRAQIALDESLTVVDADMPGSAPLQIGSRVVLEARHWRLFPS